MSNAPIAVMVGQDYQAYVARSVVELLQHPRNILRTGFNGLGSTQLLRPINGITGLPYFGANAIQLLLAAPTRDPRWLTQRQIMQEGYSIQKGTTGALVEYQERTKSGPPKVYHAAVFHGSVVHGLPAFPEQPDRHIKAVEFGKRIVAAIDISVVEDGLKQGPTYSRILDLVHTRPRPDHPSEGHYLSVVLQGAAWSLGRQGAQRPDIGSLVGSAKYAQEDLQAHLATLLLAAETGLPFEPGRHPGQAKAWVRALTQDKFAFFDAAEAAERVAAKFLEIGRAQTLALTPTMAVLRDPGLPVAPSPPLNPAPALLQQAAAVAAIEDQREGVLLDPLTLEPAREQPKKRGKAPHKADDPTRKTGIGKPVTPVGADEDANRAPAITRRRDR